MLLTKGDLRLLDDQLAKLARTPYFYGTLDSYLEQLRETTAKLLSEFDKVPAEIARGLTRQIWIASKFLSGSASREIPYEIVYALNMALRDWHPPSSRKLAITTALLDDQQYYFLGISPLFYKVTQDLLGITFQYDLVQIALPRLYKHRPTYNAALYHELGHFVEQYHRITRFSALLLPAMSPASTEESERAQQHMKEHFADLFAASYVGEAIIRILSEIAPSEGASKTHPAMKTRIEVVTAYLEGKQNNIVDILMSSMKALSLAELNHKFTHPDISNSFGNIRPHRLSSDSEVHGILLSAYKFIDATLKSPPAAWSGIEEGDVVRIVNDLLEKSVRNRMITNGWT
ncbi:MAG: hypothetical protein ACRDF4_01215, partial [Rhabdochlamydiaceae bacterium]